MAGSIPIFNIAQLTSPVVTKGVRILILGQEKVVADLACHSWTLVK